MNWAPMMRRQAAKPPSDALAIQGATWALTAFVVKGTVEGGGGSLEPIGATVVVGAGGVVVTLTVV